MTGRGRPGSGSVIRKDEHHVLSLSPQGSVPGMARTKEIDGVVYELVADTGVLAGGQKWVWRSLDNEHTIEATEDEAAEAE